MRYIPRELADVLRQATRHFPAVLVTGPRRAGKTTLLRELFPAAQYVLLEDPDATAQPGSPGGAGQGFGLLGMQERAALVGATLEIESSAGKGTTVLVRMAAAGAAAAAGSDHV